MISLGSMSDKTIMEKYTVGSFFFLVGFARVAPVPGRVPNLAQVEDDIAISGDPDVLAQLHHVWRYPPLQGNVLALGIGAQRVDDKLGVAHLSIGEEPLESLGELFEFLLAPREQDVQFKDGAFVFMDVSRKEVTLAVGC